ncbi:hypothetical protein DNHGIG_05860 [Collibacillus ludicampi]|uniref:Uncharacterized protein n=1 Tax=Collibacillus ludicampi TaxID=2771369 RepID=A0AAV4LB16_9BACL|nr:hypothetical protein DNHGIG_05860 [Collibacillus ludicampi]
MNRLTKTSKMEKIISPAITQMKVMIIVCQNVAKKNTPAQRFHVTIII